VDNRRASSGETLIWVERAKILEGHQGRPGLAGSLDDDALPGHCLVE
jgi:hypothetical protein